MEERFQLSRRRGSGRSGERSQPFPTEQKVNTATDVSPRCSLPAMQNHLLLPPLQAFSSGSDEAEQTREASAGFTDKDCLDLDVFFTASFYNYSLSTPSFYFLLVVLFSEIFLHIPAAPLCRRC